MRDFETVIIGGGQAGLALSACLSARGVDHVVFERARLAERWRSERWDSLRLLTPNWMTRLPGAPAVESRHGFMSKDEVIRFFETYARTIGAPIREGVEVTHVAPEGGGYRVETSAGSTAARNVVIATGHCGKPYRPILARELDASMLQIDANAYRNPEGLPAGGVLVVGSGASGLQIALELRRAGREVVLAVGRHARAPRRYRGRDLWWWLDRVGALEATVDTVENLDAARRSPSLGLTGANGGEDIDLGILGAEGITVTGRLTGFRGHQARFADDLHHNLAEAERRLRRLLDRFDAMASADGTDRVLGPPTRPLPVRLPPSPTGVDLDAKEIGTIVWCTGYRRSYPWLGVPALDEQGEIVHRRGVTSAPGLYVLGLQFMWHRGSHLIDGVGEDAAYLAELIVARSSVGRAA